MGEDDPHSEHRFQFPYQCPENSLVFSKASYSFLLSTSASFNETYFGTSEGQHWRWFEPATAFRNKGTMIALKMSPETWRLPCHVFSFSRITPHRVVGLLSHLVQTAGNQPANCWYYWDCIWMTYNWNELLTVKQQGFHCRHLSTASADRVFPPILIFIDKHRLIKGGWGRLVLFPPVFVPTPLILCTIPYKAKLPWCQQGSVYVFCMVQKFLKQI